MILLNQNPPGADQDLSALYQRMSAEGLVQSTVMHGEHYETSDDFDEDWACPAITWSAGGEELYHLENGATFSINPAGALILAAGARYNYAAARDRSFYSNMITFPRWMTSAAASCSFNDEREDDRRLSTRMLRPDDETQALMNDVVAHCRSGFGDDAWYVEKTALLYNRLLDAEHCGAAGCEIEAAKASTRKELARRIRRAQEFMLQSYRDAALDIDAVAKSACLSPFHLIRVFKALTRVTPMQYLAAVRMEAALRLLHETTNAVTDVAALVGFRNRSAFSRAFSRHHGIAPARARRRAY